VIITFLSAYTD